MNRRSVFAALMAAVGLKAQRGVVIDKAETREAMSRYEQALEAERTATSVAVGGGNWKCLQCGAEFPDAGGMMRHLDTLGIKHGPQTVDGKPPRYPSAASVTVSRVTPVADKCPVCGTMAEPYVRPVWNTDLYRPCPDSPTSLCFDRAGMPYGPMDRVTRCKRCNAAFWQDAAK